MTKQEIKTAIDNSLTLTLIVNLIAILVALPLLAATLPLLIGRKAAEGCSIKITGGLRKPAIRIIQN